MRDSYSAEPYVYASIELRRLAATREPTPRRCRQQRQCEPTLYVREVNCRSAVNVDHFSRSPTRESNHCDHDDISDPSVKRSLSHITNCVHVLFAQSKVDVQPAPEQMHENEIGPPCWIDLKPHELERNDASILRGDGYELVSDSGGDHTQDSRQREDAIAQQSPKQHDREAYSEKQQHRRHFQESREDEHRRRKRQ